MKTLLYVMGVVASAAIGWQVGNPLLPPAPELESAVFPVLGAITGGGVALLVIAIVAASNRNQR